MTAQIPETLLVEHPDFDPGVWSLYGVIRGQPSAENHGWGSNAQEPNGRAYRADPGNPPMCTTANWRGFTEVWKLHASGALELVQFDYAMGSTTRAVHEMLAGDFSMVLKATFEGPRLYVPFADGRIVLFRAAWKHERPRDDKPHFNRIALGCHPRFPHPLSEDD